MSSGNGAAIGKPDAARDPGQGARATATTAAQITPQLRLVEGDVGAVPAGGVEGEAVPDPVAGARDDGLRPLLLGRGGGAVELQEQKTDNDGGGGRERPQDPQAGTERVHGQAVSPRLRSAFGLLIAQRVSAYVRSRS